MPPHHFPSSTIRRQPGGRPQCWLVTGSLPAWLTALRNFRYRTHLPRDVSSGRRRARLRCDSGYPFLRSGLIKRDPTEVNPVARQKSCSVSSSAVDSSSSPPRPAPLAACAAPWPAALTPGSIAWGSVGLIVGGDDPSVHGLDVGDVENYLLTMALRGANSFGHPLLAAASMRSWNTGRATRSGGKARAARLATVARLSDGSLEATGRSGLHLPRCSWPPSLASASPQQSIRTP
jgi:hypothetical protein